MHCGSKRLTLQHCPGGTIGATYAHYHVLEYAMLPHANAIVISISDQHAVVGRYRQTPDGALTWERATNAEELEADAIAAVVATLTEDAPFLIGEHHPCPPELAARARWD